MSPEEARHVTYSFGRVFPYRARLTDRFYDTLFELDPAARALFPRDMSGQKEKLGNTLHYVVNNLHDLSGVMAAVAALGARHAEYGATTAHYEAVGIALVTALKHITPGGLSTEEERAWITAYGAISAVMMEAGEKALQAQRSSA